MKPILLVSILVLSFTSCKDKSQDPTIFEGKVVYEDDGSPFVDGEVSFAGMWYYVYARTYVFKDSLLNNTGSFKIEFEYEEEIDYFDLHIKLFKDTVINNVEMKVGNGIISTNIGGLNCSPYDCDDFEPGKTYSDLVIKVPR